MKTILDITPEEIAELFTVLGLDGEEGELKYEITRYSLEIESNNEYGSFISIYPGGYIGCMRKDDNEPDEIGNITEGYRCLYSININPIRISSLIL